MSGGNLSENFVPYVASCYRCCHFVLVVLRCCLGLFFLLLVCLLKLLIFSYIVGGCGSSSFNVRIVFHFSFFESSFLISYLKMSGN